MLVIISLLRLCNEWLEGYGIYMNILHSTHFHMKVGRLNVSARCNTVNKYK